MNINEIMDTVKGLVGEGKLEEAQTFIKDHKDDLGDYYDKAKDLIDGNSSSLLDKAKDLFN